MQIFKDMMYISILVDAGVDREYINGVIESGKFICPNCLKEYSPTHPNKEEAFRTNDLVSREQWLSHICSDECRNKCLGGFLDEF